MFKLKKQKTEQKKGENIIYKFSFFFRFNNFDLGIQEFKIILKHTNCQIKSYS